MKNVSACVPENDPTSRDFITDSGKLRARSSGHARGHGHVQCNYHRINKAAATFLFSADNAL